MTFHGELLWLNAADDRGRTKREAINVYMIVLPHLVVLCEMKRSEKRKGKGLASTSLEYKVGAFAEGYDRS